MIMDWTIYEQASELRSRGTIYQSTGLFIFAQASAKVVLHPIIHGIKMALAYSLMSMPFARVVDLDLSHELVCSKPAVVSNWKLFFDDVARKLFSTSNPKVTFTSWLVVVDADLV